MRERWDYLRSSTASLGEHFSRIRTHWVFLALAVVLPIVGGVQVLVTSFALPWWAWAIAGLLALLVAQFLAFHDVRTERDEQRDALAINRTLLENEREEYAERLTEIQRVHAVEFAQTRADIGRTQDVQMLQHTIPILKQQLAGIKSVFDSVKRDYSRENVESSAAVYFREHEPIIVAEISQDSELHRLFFDDIGIPSTNDDDGVQDKKMYLDILERRKTRLQEVIERLERRRDAIL